MNTNLILPAEITFTIFVIAYSDLQIRLVNPNNNKSGRVEIYHPSFGWGSVVSDGTRSLTDTKGSVVICRQLGFNGVSKTRNNAYYDEGSRPILLLLFGCTGSESYIWECSHAGWNMVSWYTGRPYHASVDCY